MKYFRKIYNGLCDVLDKIATVAMMIVFAVVFVNVVLRYLFKQSFAWSDEAARYAFIVMCLFGMVIATRDKSHFSVTMVIDHLPGIVQRILHVIIDVTCIVLIVFLIKGGFQMSDILSDTITPGMQIPSSFRYWVLIFSGFLMLFYEICILISDILGNPNLFSETAQIEEKGR